MTCFARKLIAGVFVTLLLGACSTMKGNDAGPDYDQGNSKKAVKVSQTSRGAMITSDERILFDTGKSEIKADGQIFLDRVTTILKDKTKANVSVEGHTDNVGSAQLNQQLSQARALAVKQAFVTRGIAASRIQTQGFGLTKPIADNSTPEGRQSNRRTEIIVLGESVENIGGTSLADKLADGLDRFLKNAAGIISNVFGGGKKE